MVAKLLSVNVGLPREISWRGQTVRTSVWKEPVQGKRLVRRLNIDGDAQGDAEHGADDLANVGAEEPAEGHIGGAGGVVEEEPAEALLGQAIHQEPGNVQALYRLGYVQYRQRKLSQARHSLTIWKRNREAMEIFSRKDWL